MWCAFNIFFLKMTSKHQLHVLPGEDANHFFVCCVWTGRLQHRFGWQHLPETCGCFRGLFFTRVRFPPVQRTLTRAMLHLCPGLPLEGSATWWYWGLWWGSLVTWCRDEFPLSLQAFNQMVLCSECPFPDRLASFQCGGGRKVKATCSHLPSCLSYLHCFSMDGFPDKPYEFISPNCRPQCVQ